MCISCLPGSLCECSTIPCSAQESRKSHGCFRHRPSGVDHQDILAKSTDPGSEIAGENHRILTDCHVSMPGMDSVSGAGADKKWMVRLGSVGGIGVRIVATGSNSRRPRPEIGFRRGGDDGSS